MSQDMSVNSYNTIRETVLTAKNKVYTAVNLAMVEAYRDIGKQIAEAQGESAEYGKQLIKYLSEQLTAEFGTGFDVRNLQNMRQFYLAFPNTNTVFVMKLVTLSFANAHRG